MGTLSDNEQTKLNETFAELLRRMRTGGLALVCYNRCQTDTLSDYKNFLINHLSYGMMDISRAEALANQIIEFTQTPDSNLGSISRTIEAGFIDNSQIEALRKENHELKLKLYKSKFDEEIHADMKTPFRSLFKTMIRVFKLAEKGAIPPLTK